MVRLGRFAHAVPAVTLCLLIGCQPVVQYAPVAEGKISVFPGVQASLERYELTGNVSPLLDPSVIRQGSTYYVFSTDVIGLPPGNDLPIRCSEDEVNWRRCGSVFPDIPAWVRQNVPGVVGLWAPDISFFNGLYHVYYTASTLYSQRSVIGLATNTTLDQSDPRYKWVDAGEVLESSLGDDFNALDPNIFIDQAGSIWMTFGSYWSGIKQVQIDSRTGRPAANGLRISLATRPGVPDDPIEGASMVRHGGYYYLFVSVDYCCKASYLDDNYKQIVGRATSPQGPFVDMNGTPLMEGGGTILLQAQGPWNAPGGGTAYVDSQTGESLLVFHALKLTESGASYLWLKHVEWQNDWPVLN
jgi:arabinan endo-1,5-alpha-L-arabinosidase